MATGYPIPTDESEFAEDERKAIIEFDGGGKSEIDKPEGEING